MNCLNSNKHCFDKLTPPANCIIVLSYALNIRLQGIYDAFIPLEISSVYESIMKYLQIFLLYLAFDLVYFKIQYIHDEFQ